MCDISNGTSLDCNQNHIPDECDIEDQTSLDCNGNDVPDECDIADGTSLDCNGNEVPDECDLGTGFSEDCNANGIPDECDIADETSEDLNGNGVPDECECPDPNTYCVTSPNSVGPGALIGSVGLPSVSVNNFVLSASSGPPGQPGIFYYGSGQVQLPFGNGFRCVGGSVSRLPSVTIANNGRAFYQLDFTQPPANGGPGEITPGSTWNFQFWYRDPQGGGHGFNLSDGLEVTFCP
jgi:hypothetical protein